MRTSTGGSHDLLDRVPLLLAFYGDDFTGSTDALESLVAQGLPAILFLDPPDPDALKAKYPEVRAIGVAGTARSLGPDQMREALRPVFHAIAALSPDFVHYKVCSTYDSAPHVGSIGVAMEVAQEALNPSHVLHLGGAPHLGRYLVFGHLFARYGGDDRVYRIDRHPVMKEHPSTPMHESDLALHLGLQTIQFCFRNVPIDTVRRCDPSSEPSVYTLLEATGGVPRTSWVFDALEERDEQTFAEVCLTLRNKGHHPFLVGGSSVEHALASAIHAREAPTDIMVEADLEPSEPLVVVSGSCSPMTARQIDASRDKGFVVLDLDTHSLDDPNGRARAARKLVRQITTCLRDGRSVVVRSCGAAGSSEGRRRISPEHIGHAYAALLTALADAGRLHRFAIAGGDVSSFTIRALGVQALKMKVSAAPGVPLCTIDAPGTPFDALEVALKGGQLGPRDFFVRLRDGFAGSQ